MPWRCQYRLRQSMVTWWIFQTLSTDDSHVGRCWRYTFRMLCVGEEESWRDFLPKCHLWQEVLHPGPDIVHCRVRPHEPNSPCVTWSLLRPEYGCVQLQMLLQKKYAAQLALSWLVWIHSPKEGGVGSAGNLQSGAQQLNELPVFLAFTEVKAAWGGLSVLQASDSRFE